MACRMTELVVDALDPDRLAGFWCEVLGWEVTRRSDYEVEIAPADAPTELPRFVFLRSGNRKAGEPRLHLDLRPTDLRHVEELDRLLGIGAVHADIGQGDVMCPGPCWPIPRGMRSVSSIRCRT